MILFLLCCLLFDLLYFCHRTNHICSMTSLTNLDLTPYPWVRTIFALFPFVLTSLLVAVVFWDLMFSHQQEYIPKVTFLRLTFSYQKESSPKVVDSLKCFGAKCTYFHSKFETQFYIKVVVRLCIARSNLCSFTKNMIRRVTMGTICRPSDSVSGGTDTTASIQCTNGLDPEINELWCLGLYRI